PGLPPGVWGRAPAGGRPAAGAKPLPYPLLSIAEGWAQKCQSEMLCPLSRFIILDDKPLHKTPLLKKMLRRLRVRTSPG
ncbi:MAG: hypothetical protein ACE5HL_10015, partial [Terriglobia bacterium]